MVDTFPLRTKPLAGSWSEMAPIPLIVRTSPVGPVELPATLVRLEDSYERLSKAASTVLDASAVPFAVFAFPVSVSVERCTTEPDIVSVPHVEPSGKVQFAWTPATVVKLTIANWALPETVLPLVVRLPLAISAQPLFEFFASL